MQTPMNENIDRRRALSILASFIAGLWSTGAAVVAGAFVTSPLRRRREATELSIGRTVLYGDDFSLVQLDVPIEDGWHKRVEHLHLYARAIEGGDPMVFSATCTHLGCTVRWNPDSAEFECPCHGGRFSELGDVLSGPPPAPLKRVPAQVRDGEIFVQLT